ncbi:hypothetical protein HZ326_1064 [Fusarium oxysporum f. sp. albedinis]|nr:hypothetical protein HZ326_1064 [Fusarium oxysporum f. sp. albedinis]
MPGSGGTQDFEFLSNVEYGMFAVSSHGCCEYADISLQVLSKLRWYIRRPTNYVPCWFCGAGEAVGCLLRFFHGSLEWFHGWECNVDVGTSCLKARSSMHTAI